MRMSTAAMAAQLDGAPAGEEDQAQAPRLHREGRKILSDWFWTMWGGRSVLLSEFVLAGTLACGGETNGSI